ncbi:MAG: Nif3-like dinuclear metal center hexameric protein [Chloroflexota bacterium]
MNRAELVSYLDDYLRINEIGDYGPQGLQIEGKEEVRKIVALVDSHQPCVEAALEKNADLMLVHHGIFWGPPRLLSGSYGRLVRTFMDANLNLYAAHLALDAHPEVGNNAELANRLRLKIVDWWANIKGTPLAALTEVSESTTLDELVTRIQERVGPIQVVQRHGPNQIRRIGILSGGGASHVEEAAALGCDTYITGETSHANYYDALNAGINVIYVGHYQSEVVGVQALGKHLVEKFGVGFEFVDLPTEM